MLDVNEKIEIPSELSKPFKLLGKIFFGVSSVVFLGAIYNYTQEHDYFHFLLFSLILLFFAVGMLSYNAKIFISRKFYTLENKIFGCKWINNKNIEGWKVLRVSARADTEGTGIKSNVYIELDLSPIKGQKWMYGDIFLSSHFTFDYNEAPNVVSKMVVRIQRVTGFDVEFDDVCKKKFFATYKTLMNESGYK
ncbi:hypothetical protein OLEAN_C33960 [Oleispira antarctica RB-8]|uniref:Uncharacterized protein n=1 Tax=Oleispira antarctica RB-8 TaxID=698738 RepID=R4YR74_OLEAN|nr:hypothetical protein OLEAN_C33960 [Oleispira antarctica RB-8]